MALHFRTERPAGRDDQLPQPSASEPLLVSDAVTAPASGTRFHHWESLRPHLHDFWGERSQSMSDVLWKEKAGVRPAAAGTRFHHWEHLRHRRSLVAHTGPLSGAEQTPELATRAVRADSPAATLSATRPKVTKPLAGRSTVTKPPPAGQPVMSLQLLPVRVSLPPAVIPPEQRALEPVAQEERALIVPEEPELPAQRRPLPKPPAAGAPLPGRPYTRAQVLHRHWKRGRLHASTLRYRRQQRRVGIGLTASVLIPSMLALMVMLAAAGLGFLYYTYEKAQLLALASELPKDSLKVYDSQGNLIYQLADQGLQTTVPLDQISPNVINATIAIEDKDFWQNQGVDFLAVVRAATADAQNGQIVSGASTITQQLIKNALVGPAPTFDRKLREMILALGATQNYSKQQILSFYLNTIYYGEQAYGIDAAAQLYFSLPDSPDHPAAGRLDLAQASMLAGLPRAPSEYDPVVNIKQALERQKQVLQQMVIDGYISSADAVQAEDEAASPGFIKPGHPINLIPGDSDYVLSELQGLMDSGQVPEDILSRSGLKIVTTLNMSLQNQMLKIAQQHINAMRVAHHMSDASVVMIDYHTGAIEVLIGSINPNSQFNVATQGYRQPGSSFKPFVYATAFEKGWSPGTAISDTPVSIFVSEGEPLYSPTNYDFRFHGEMTLRHALQNSFNVPAVKVEMFAGVKQSLATAQAMGITSYEGTPGPSMVLGGLSVHLLDETSAYGVFANGGIRMQPYIIQEIYDSQGHLIYQHQAQGQRIISAQVAGLITNVLSDDKERQYEFGVCSPLMLYNGTPYSAACQRGDTGVVRPAAAKTGTTGDFKDNWTVGYTSDYVIGVWAGNDNGDPMVNVSGVDGAAPIWHDSMLLAEQGRPVVPFTLPPGLVRATVHYPDGVTSTDWYLPGTVPAGGVIVGHS